MKIFKKVKQHVGKSSSNPAAALGSSPRGTPTCDLDNIWGELQGMMGDAFRSFPVHKDLHRFASTTFVWDVDGNRMNTPELFADEQDDERRRRFLPTKRVLWALASAVDPAKRDEIMSKFEETVVGGSVNDIVGSMSEFFALIDDRDAVVPRLRTLRILKLVNQAILAPAVIHLNVFLSKGPEKDIYMNAGAWKIHVKFLKDGRISVRHAKWEKNKDSSFKWHLKMTLNDSLSMLEEVSLSFLKVKFPSTEEGEARRRAFIEYIGKFYSGQEQIADQERMMWNRSHHSLPIHKSLPTVAFRTTITMDGSHLFAPAPDASAQQNLKSLLLALAHTFSPSKEEVILREFDKQYQENDVVASLKLFLRETLRLSDEDGNECSGLTAVLKTLHSSVVAPCLSLLHERLIALADSSSPLATLPAFSDKGEWNITINILPPESDEGELLQNGSSTESQHKEEEDNGSQKGKEVIGSDSDSDGGHDFATEGKRYTRDSTRRAQPQMAAEKRDERWVMVRHSKLAASETKSDAPNFVEFGWNVELNLDRQLRRMTAVHMHVEDIQFGVNVDSDVQREIAIVLQRAIE